MCRPELPAEPVQGYAACRIRAVRQKRLMGGGDNVHPITRPGPYASRERLSSREKSSWITFLGAHMAPIAPIVHRGLLLFRCCWLPPWRYRINLPSTLKLMTNCMETIVSPAIT